MTVGELIERLQRIDPKRNVSIAGSNSAGDYVDGDLITVAVDRDAHDVVLSNDTTEEFMFSAYDIIS